MLLQQLTWPDLKESAELVCVLLLGVTEQRGPHHPLWTDTAIVGEIAWRAEMELKDLVMLAPMQNIVSYIKAACRSIRAHRLPQHFSLEWTWRE